MDDIEKAKELLLDDHNFANPGTTMVAEHLELIQFIRAHHIWVALFRTKHYRNDIYEVTYDTNFKMATIVAYDIRNKHIIHDE